MDYRSLAQVEKQWPDVGGHDLYYGGNAYENRSGLGQQWPAAGAADPFSIPMEPVGTQHEGLQFVRTSALYTPGTLINHSAVLAPRMAQPTLLINPADGDMLSLSDGDWVTLQMAGKSLEMNVCFNSETPEGLVLLRGISFIPGLFEAQVNQIAEPQEKELVT